MLSFSSEVPSGILRPRRPTMKTALKKTMALTFSGLIFAGLGATLLFGKAEYTKKEKKACVTCHVKSGSKELNDVGKCYAKNHSLKDCETPPAK
jgi:hypothetical protein